jgi:light-regulated signal transduction histidine kinase (bacteriophytochrome)
MSSATHGQVDSAVVVGDVLASLHSVLRERRALVSVSGLPILCAHEAQLATLFRGVILNALAYASPGGRPRLTIDADRGSCEWRFSVVDKGNERTGRRVSSFVFTVPDA